VRALVPLLALTVACARSDDRWVEALADPDPFERALAALALCEQAPERAPLALDVLLETVDRSELGLGAVAARSLEIPARIAPNQLRKRLSTDPFMTTERRRALQAALRAVGAERP
jgi:hypothetical protein